MLGAGLDLSLDGLRRTDKCPGATVCPANNPPAGVETELSPAMQRRVLRREAMLVLAKNGVSISALVILLECSVSTVHRWLLKSRNTGELVDLPRPGRPAIFSQDIAIKVVAFYCQVRPLPGCGRWTLTWAAAHLAAQPAQVGASPARSTIHRFLQKQSLKPHLSRYFLHITDPDFFPKMEHIIALLRNPPANLFFFDECPGIQVLKRLTPDQQTNEMKMRLEEFEYIRNGTIDVLAFLAHTDGKVYAECCANHEIVTFLGVFRRHVEQAPAKEQLHYVMDNLASHRSYPFCQLVGELSGVPCPSKKMLDSQTKRVEWLQATNKRIVIHFTPFHGSWLNLVEIWFGILGARVLRESFGCPDALKAAIEYFVEQWNQLLAHPFQWSYDGIGLHAKAVKRFILMLQNAAADMELRVLTKSLTLMSNLMDGYVGEVPAQAWSQLVETVEHEHETINALIDREKGPRRKEKAREALAGFKARSNAQPWFAIKEAA